MKKVLLLGGSYFQVPSIIKAREMGYYSISCDYLPNNPGHKFAHEYHNVSTTDKESVLDLARKLNIDGVVCYASDPAAPVAAYVSEQLGLAGNPYRSVEILSNKDKFRDFLQQNHFNTPKAKGYSTYEEAKQDIKKYKLPVMIKPVDSSGSKGVSKLTDIHTLEEMFLYAQQFSRVQKVIMEEFVDKKGYQIAGDGFSVNGKLKFRCFANEHFELQSKYPFVPIGESWPYNQSNQIHDKIHQEIQRALTLLGMKTGAYNFDIRIDADDNVFLMEIGPRNGGNLIPQVTKYATGVDMVEYTIRAAMGECCNSLRQEEVKGFWSCYMIHSENSGHYKNIILDEKFKEDNIVEFQMNVKEGEHIEAFTGSNGTLGTMILKFNSMDEMLCKMDHIGEFVKVIVE